MNTEKFHDLRKWVGWAVVWRRLDHVEKVARVILDDPDDIRREEAEKITAVVGRVRRAYRRGWDVPAEELDRLWQLCDAADKKCTAKVIEHGRKFLDAPKRPRRDTLARLIDNALAALPANATTAAVLNKVVALDGGRFIQEVEGDGTIWIRGKDASTKWKTFQNRVSARRKFASR